VEREVKISTEVKEGLLEIEREGLTEDDLIAENEGKNSREVKEDRPEIENEGLKLEYLSSFKLSVDREEK